MANKSYYSIALSAPAQGTLVEIRLRPINPQTGKQDEDCVEGENPFQKSGYKGLVHGAIERIAFRAGELEQAIDNVNDPRHPPTPPCFEGPIDVKKRPEIPKLFKAESFFSDVGRVTSLSRLAYQEYVVAIEHSQDTKGHGFVVLLEQFIHGQIVDRDFIVFV